jgi:hypothetical protein
MVHWFKNPGALGWVVYATLWLLTGSRLGAQPASNTTPCPAPTTGEEKQSAESKGSGEARTNGLDLEAVKKVVREELKAEKEQSKKYALTGRG